jgi:SAM-dependent methyltransferase
MLRRSLQDKRNGKAMDPDRRMKGERKAPSRNVDLETARTISDFGDQWTKFRENEGYYASLEMLRDHLEPLMDVRDLRGKVVAEIGSGTGRIVRMLVSAGAAKVFAFEPSASYQVLCENVSDIKDRVECHQLPGDQVPNLNLDGIFSIGVVHHIPNPIPVMNAAFNALRPGGRIFIWLYGAEGNEAYLRFATPLRRLTTKLPHALLMLVCRALNVCVGAYIWLARRARVPMKRYLTEVLGRFPSKTRLLIIYDQLNPAYAKYYRKDEARGLLEQAGFVKIALYHRHGYSWSVTGVRPDAPPLESVFPSETR